jgi:hypothetical protein
MTSTRLARSTSNTGPRGWSTSATVTLAARKLWDRGAILRELNLPPEEWVSFPHRVRLSVPSAADLVEHRAEAQAWSRALNDSAANADWDLLTKRIRAGVLGMQTIPTAAIISTPTVALNLLAAIEVLDYLARDVALRRPFDVLAAGDDWPILVKVAQWLLENPRPGIYVRQVPVPGLHTKVIEQHRPILTRLLDTVLAATDIAPEHSDFAHRFGFIDEARSVRIRGDRAVLGLPLQGAEPTSHLESDAAPDARPALVHPTLGVLLTDDSLGDVTWPITALAALDAPAVGVRELVIVENKISFLTTPHQPGRLILWGAGYGADQLLHTLEWRDRVAVTYWGDLDTHGLHILDAVRSHAPHVRSVLMDLDTLEAHKPYWSREGRQRAGALIHLTESEQLLYQALLQGELGESLRLEQEYIGYERVAFALSTSSSRQRDQL